jgi:hypothetical protein
VSQLWWSWSGSNRRPPECKSGALPAELQPLLRSAARFTRRGLRDVIEASWIQGTRISNPHPLSDSLPYALSGDPVACSLPVPWFYPEDLVAVYGMERLSPTRPRCTLKRFWLSETPSTVSLRKEVIQPQVLLRLPCYDFTPIMDHTLGRCPPCGSACRLLVQSTFVM